MSTSYVSLSDPRGGDYVSVYVYTHGGCECVYTSVYVRFRVHLLVIPVTISYLGFNIGLFCRYLASVSTRSHLLLVYVHSERGFTVGSRGPLVHLLTSSTKGGRWDVYVYIHVCSTHVCLCV